jgi:hypothetical protein
LDVAFLLPGLKPLRGARAAIRGVRAARGGEKAVRAATAARAALQGQIAENLARQQQIAKQIAAGDAGLKPEIDHLTAERAQLVGDLDKLDNPNAVIPEREVRIEEWKRMGLSAEQIKAATLWHDNQAALYHGGPAAFWRERMRLPTGERAGQFVAGHPGGAVLYQHPETKEAARLRAKHGGKGEPIETPDRAALRDIAFEGVDTSVFREHDIGGFLDKIPEYIQRGTPYRHWYRDSGRAILRLAQGDKGLASRVAQVVAIYSASRQPTENINLAMKAIRQWHLSGRISGVGTASQVTKANAIMQGKPWAGRKTNRFYANMLKWIDDPEHGLATGPGSLSWDEGFRGGEVTNDIWMARLFGLKSDIPTPREYDAMTRITQNIAAAHGWSPEEVQAALWVPAKADAGRTVTGLGGVKRRVPLDDHEAGIDFARALDQESAQMAVEAAPGRLAAPELHAAYHELTPEARAAYTNAHKDSAVQWINETGLFGDVVAVDRVGIYENATNPAFTLSFPLGGERAIKLDELGKARYTKKGEVMKEPLATTGRAGKRFMTDVMSILGAAMNQDAMAWFRPYYRREKITQQNGTLIKLSRPLTEDETVRLHRLLQERMGYEVPLPPAEGHNLFALHFPDEGLSAVARGRANTKFHDVVEQAIEDATHGGRDLEAETVPFRHDGDFRARRQYTGAARRLAGTQKGLPHPPSRGLLGRPDVLEATRRLHERARRIDAEHLGAGRTAAPRGEPARGLAPALYQRGKIPAKDLPRGATEFLKEGGTRVHYFEGADFSTVMHELFHVSLHDLKGRHFLTLADEFAAGKPIAEWTEAEHEAAAAAFEQWLRTGEITNPKLRSAFLAIQEFMLKLVGKAKGTGMRVPKDVEDAFNYMFREPPEKRLQDEVVKAAKRAKEEVYPAQEVKRSVERSERFSAMEAARAEAGGGIKGQQAALEQLSGEYWKEPFDDLTHLEEPDMEYLIDEVGAARRLRGIEKTKLIGALQKANRGEVFTPSDATLVFKAFGDTKVMRKGLTRTQRAMALLTQIVNIPRSFMSSFDVSGILRQGLMTAVMHPVMTAKLTPHMMRYLFSEKYYLERMARFREDPRYHVLTTDGGLELTDTGHEFGSEEAYQSHVAELLTGGKWGPIRASGRAYTGLLNDLRWGSSTNMFDLALESGMLTPEELKRIGKVSNWATGRGHLGKHDQSAQLLNLFLFSPRLLKSRFDTLNPWFYKSLDPEGRLFLVRWSQRTPAQKQALKATTRLLLAGGSILGLAKLAGADIELDPRSSDFAKIKVGDTRVDIWGGHQPFVRTFFQTLAGMRKITSTGELRHVNYLDPIFRFFESKASPPMSLALDYHRGRTIPGDPFRWGPVWDPKSAIGSRLYPLGLGDTWEAYGQADDKALAALIFALSFVGLSTQTYSADVPERPVGPLPSIAEVGTRLGHGGEQGAPREGRGEQGVPREGGGEQGVPRGYGGEQGVPREGIREVGVRLGH